MFQPSQQPTYPAPGRLSIPQRRFRNNPTERRELPNLAAQHLEAAASVLAEIGGRAAARYGEGLAAIALRVRALPVPKIEVTL